MKIDFKENESFVPSFAYSNSQTAIERFPFPFPEDTYMYSVNLEPHVSVGTGVYQHVFDVDEHYIAECNERARALKEQPGIHYASLPHMIDGQWDVLELLMESYAKDYPQWFSLSKQGTTWTWKNKLLNEERTFEFGDASTLPYEPMEYITRQAQGDWVLLEERDDSLIIGAGMTTERADYSLRFNVGMSFNEFHGPVPVAHELKVFERALKFLQRLRTGHPVRRLNWSLTVNPRLETSAETLHLWGPDRTTVTPENAGKAVYLRVELQPLHRLPRSNAILFNIRTYLANLEELVTVPKWGRRLHRVFGTLDPRLADYKGLTRYLDTATAWLAKYDDGAPTSPGMDKD